MPTLKGTETSLFDVQYFLYFVSSSINISIFHSIWLGTFWIYLVTANGGAPKDMKPTLIELKREIDSNT